MTDRFVGALARASPPAARCSRALPDGRPMRLLTLGEPGTTLSVLCIGAHSDDIEIGAGARIGAGAVVITDVPAGAVAVGNPARLVGERQESAS